MTTVDPLARINTRATPQNRPVSPDQIRNAAGGYVFQADDLTRFRRFLATGTTGGTYYASEADHTADNAEVLMRLVNGGHAREVWDTVREASLGGFTAKQQPLMFSMAVLAAQAPEDVRRDVLDGLPDVARTGTHLFLFLRYVEQFRGWGRSLRRGVANWYLSKDPDRLGYQIAKYAEREGFTHRDALRLAHPKVDHALVEAGHGAVLDGQRALFDYACGREVPVEALPGAVRAKTRLHAAESLDAVLAVLRDASAVSWEMVPSQWLTHRQVWETLLDTGNLPLGALLRNLPRLTNLGILADLGDPAAVRYTEQVVRRLTDREALRKARVHPMQVLLAAGTYRTGRSQRGSSTWHPVTAINNALNTAFPESFASVEPVAKRAVIGVDVSGSMDSPIFGTGLTSRDAAVALAQVYAHQFTGGHDGLAFTARGSSGFWGTGRNEVVPLDISPQRRTVDVLTEARGMRFGRTDCALPMLYAMDRGVEADVFVILTDSETWAGDIHPHQALRRYREKTGIPARLVTVSMVANSSTIADPSDPLQMDVVGLDMSAVTVATEFAAGKI